MTWCEMPADPYGVVYTFALENQRSVRAEGNFIYFEDVGGGIKAWEAGDAAYALSLVAAIKVVMTTPPTGAPFTVTISPPGLTFVSITPNTASVGGTTFAGAVAGTGFLGSGITDMNLDDGAGHVISCSFSTDSDIQITLTALLGGGSWPASGTYTAYYSTNGGSVWTTTGLTVTVS